MKRFVGLLGFLVVAMLVPGDGRAIVNQVDGQVVPQTNRLQQCLDNSEGQVPPLGVSAVFDAALQPEVFLPVDGAQVVFRDLAEGAGYRNSFGWYNVGDDVTLPANLHTIFGCRTQAGQCACPCAWLNRGAVGDPNQISVDISADASYAGGYIGFWLRTPERLAGGSDPDNCGGAADDLNRIYFTESALNDDGDFVHYLVYTSRQIADTFYFGFEDLFRGGDNDFEDMLVRVNGLIPPCSPSPEACNNLDDDCDGVVDDGLTQPCASACGPGVRTCEAGAFGACDAPQPVAEACNGLDDDCDGEIDEGLTQGCATACGAGTEYCIGGVFVDCDAPLADAEVCNGIDDDCDGTIDGMTRPCGTACGQGDETCVAGVWQGCDAEQPEVEDCDDVDDDCDGEVDEGITRPCASACGVGSELCANGVYIDCDAPEPVAELCNGLDDDCDGSTDEELTRPCASSCGPGTEMCELGQWIDCDAPEPVDEVCNGEDDDCDGDVDEGNPGGGAACGEEEGECFGGATRCVAGEVQCVGGQGPVPEECNGLDDDCDGETDEDNPGGGGPCGNDAGECALGTLECIGGRYECVDESVPEPEECNGLDDDCDGVIDDGNPGGGLPCDEDRCEPGETRCVAGEIQCVGGADALDETCNCQDDDCDDLVDENPDELCPPGSQCIDCGCRLPCTSEEFELECPPSMECVDSFCVPGRCAGVECDEGTVCRQGDCIDLCEGVSCRDGYLCRSGRCIEDNCYGLGCPAGEVCVELECVADPCTGITCDEQEFCREGDCVRSCAAVTCPEGQSCTDGACRDDACSGVTCRPGRVCAGGECVEDPCANVGCGTGRVCVDGGCIDDPCAHIDCPGEDVCRLGQCVTPPSDAPFVAHRGLATGGGGLDCSVGAPGAGGSTGAWLVAALLALIALARRRRLHAGPKNNLSPRAEGRGVGVRGAAVAAIVGLALVGAGCDVDPYCFDCPAPGEDGGPDRVEVPDGCISRGGELCNEEDDDCDGLVDEDFDLVSDPANCGGCGFLCVLDRAVPDCVEGGCAVAQCEPGWVDLDGLPQNGCEYECLARGDEICNERDDDCDFAVDEGFDLQLDSANCGVCGNVCAFLHGDASCVAGACTLGGCDDGYVDLDEDPENGCEYSCGPGAAETCDGADNDCDGQVDEDFDLDTDPDHCGSCVRRCAFDHADAACIGGQCTVEGCEEGFVDGNGLVADGCESECDGLGAAETCDGGDNDCDGLVDEDDPLTGTPCGDDTGECEAGQLVCRRGVMACAGDRGATPELCNDLDDDCDGVADDGNPGGGARCGTNVGRCEYGAITCVAGALVCVGATDPVAETCDGTDEDCDGAADDGDPGGGGSCGIDTGSCDLGTLSCRNGALECTGTVDPVSEVCNGLDDDCDDALDDGNPGGGARCGTNVGRCEFGAVACTGGALSCEGGVTAIAETCNGVDDDCNGGIDDGLVPPAVCDPDGVCAGTVATCGGAAGWQCTYGSTYQAVEVWCDGLNNDCDATTDEACKTLSGADARVDLYTAGNPPDSPANSIQVAIANDGANRIFTAWLDRRQRRADIFTNRATSAAYTWANPDLAAETNAANGVGPSIAFGDSRLYFVWEDFRDNATRRNVYFRRTTNNGLGSTFAAAESRLNTGLDNDSFNVQVVADGGGGVFAIWETQLGSDRSRRVYVASSRNSGGAFDPPFRVDANPDALPIATTPSIAVGGVGEVYAVWRDTRDGEPDIYFNRSLDGGISWLGADVRMDTDLAGTSASIQPQVAADDLGNVVVVWSDGRDGAFDIRAQRSTDSGDTWLAADVRVDTDPFDHDSFEPRAVVEAGRAWVVWEDYRDGLPDVHASVSADAGATWLTEDLRADTGAAGVAGSTHPVLAVDGGVLYVAWLDDRNGARDVYLNYALDGMTLQPADLRMDSDVAGAADSISVVLTASGGRAHAVWVDYRAAGLQSGDIYHRFLQ